jgi:hypothetical protein
MQFNLEIAKKSVSEHMYTAESHTLAPKQIYVTGRGGQKMRQPESHVVNSEFKDCLMNSG